jgi:hypothetical protein
MTFSTATMKISIVTKYNCKNNVFEKNHIWPLIRSATVIMTSGVRQNVVAPIFCTGGSDYNQLEKKETRQASNARQDQML